MIEKRLADLRQQGFCCSQCIVHLGLDILEESDPLLMKAMGGLCNGIHNGRICGAYTGAACLLSMLEPQKAADYMIKELENWFVDTYGGADKNIACASIIAEDPLNKAFTCPPLIEATAKKAVEMLTEHGWEFAD